MKIELIKQLIAEFFQSGNNYRLNDAFLLETALYIEDTFGITLEDNDINHENLGNQEAAVRLVQGRQQS